VRLKRAIRNKKIIKTTIYLLFTIYTLKGDKFNKLNQVATIMDPDIAIIKPFIRIKLFDIFLFSKSEVFIDNNDVENK
jgi:hypothetical protein